MNKLLTMAILAGALGLVGCTDKDGALEALQGAGYTEIALGGHSWFGCSEDDSFSTKFTAKGPTGKTVKGVVCSGWMKGSTIRLD